MIGKYRQCTLYSVYYEQHVRPLSVLSLYPVLIAEEMSEDQARVKVESFLTLEESLSKEWIERARDLLGEIQEDRFGDYKYSSL